MRLHTKSLVMEVIDNFLDDYYFKSFSRRILGNEFPWYWSDYEGIIQFTYIFYSKPDGNMGQPNFSILQPLLNKLRVNDLIKVKANINPQTFFHRKSGYHMDYPNMTTAIFYVKTNNGFTKFKNGTKIKSVANRMLIFDSNMEHTAVSSTDEKRRVVINFNYG